jgi:hypothetical protein
MASLPVLGFGVSSVPSGTEHVSGRRPMKKNSPEPEAKRTFRAGVEWGGYSHNSTRIPLCGMNQPSLKGDFCD